MVDDMEKLPGALGTGGSLALRLGQAVFAVISLPFMCLGIEFYTYTAFCFLVAIMGLVIPWSLTWAMVDVSSVYMERPVRPPGVLSIVIVGDWVFSFLSLAASCSAASVTDLLLASGHSFCIEKLCMIYQLAAAMAFLSCLLLLASSLINVWLLTSVWFIYMPNFCHWASTESKWENPRMLFRPLNYSNVHWINVVLQMYSVFGVGP